ncbi:hypothetical protein LCGC14_2376300 [marine sediment metagenome]|uniref:Uncharacterized protein n=1 Tax=marine sediment metagenome TaxID=412755 RepID=A0A0F9C2A6_9ZZZZ
MICWWCAEVFNRGINLEIACKIDGHILDDDFFMARQVDPECPINKEKGGVKYGRRKEESK